MIAGKENQDGIYTEEHERIKRDIIMEEIYEIIEQEGLHDAFPNFDLQDDILTQDIFEVYKILFWGISALASTLLWLYFFLN